MLNERIAVSINHNFVLRDAVCCDDTKLKRIWPRDSFEAPPANDACLVEDEKRFRWIIGKRKLRLDVVDAVMIGGGVGGSLRFREDLTLSPLRLRLHAEPTQRDRFTTSGGGSDARSTSVGGSGGCQRRADDRAGCPSRCAPGYRCPARRRRRSLTSRGLGHRRRISTARSLRHVTSSFRCGGRDRKLPLTGSGCNVTSADDLHLRAKFGHVDDRGRRDLRSTLNSVYGGGAFPLRRFVSPITFFLSRFCRSAAVAYD